MISRASADSIDFGAWCSNLYFGSGVARGVWQAGAGSVDALVLSSRACLACFLCIVRPARQFKTDQTGVNIVNASCALSELRLKAGLPACGVLAACAFDQRLVQGIARSSVLSICRARGSDSTLIASYATLTCRILWIARETGGIDASSTGWCKIFDAVMSTVQTATVIVTIMSGWIAGSIIPC